MSGSGEMSTAGFTSVDRPTSIDSTFPAGRDMAAGCDVKSDARSTKYGRIGALKPVLPHGAATRPLPSFESSDKVCLCKVDAP